MVQPPESKPVNQPILLVFTDKTTSWQGEINSKLVFNLIPNEALATIEGYRTLGYRVLWMTAQGISNDCLKILHVFIFPYQWRGEVDGSQVFSSTPVDAKRLVDSYRREGYAIAWIAEGGIIGGSANV